MRLSILTFGFKVHNEDENLRISEICFFHSGNEIGALVTDLIATPNASALYMRSGLVLQFTTNESMMITCIEIEKLYKKSKKKGWKSTQYTIYKAIWRSDNQPFHKQK